MVFHKSILLAFIKYHVEKKKCCFLTVVWLNLVFLEIQLSIHLSLYNFHLFLCLNVNKQRMNISSERWFLWYHMPIPRAWLSRTIVFVLAITQVKVSIMELMAVYPSYYLRIQSSLSARLYTLRKITWTVELHCQSGYSNEISVQDNIQNTKFTGHLYFGISRVPCFFPLVKDTQKNFYTFMQDLSSMSYED